VADGLWGLGHLHRQRGCLLGHLLVCHYRRVCAARVGHLVMHRRRVSARIHGRKASRRCEGSIAGGGCRGMASPKSAARSVAR
jgi:hypothetical protein